jgi:hypothetical protein
MAVDDGGGRWRSMAVVDGGLSMAASMSRQRAPC